MSRNYNDILRERKDSFYAIAGLKPPVEPEPHLVFPGEPPEVQAYPAYQQLYVEREKLIRKMCGTKVTNVVRAVLSFPIVLGFFWVAAFMAIAVFAAVTIDPDHSNFDAWLAPSFWAAFFVTACLTVRALWDRERKRQAYRKMPLLKVVEEYKDQREATHRSRMEMFARWDQELRDDRLVRNIAREIRNPSY